MELAVAALLTALCASLLFQTMRVLPEALSRATVRMGFGGGVPRFATRALMWLAIVWGLATIVAATLGPAPTLYGAVGLLMTPLWRDRTAQNKTPFVAPVTHGLERGQRALYLLASVAVIIGILRDAAAGA